jgi:hypothetical protein
VKRTGKEGKTRYDLLPPQTLRQLAEVLTRGAEKYKPNGWREVDDPRPMFEAAAMRHFEAYRMGMKHDLETGLPHLVHAICNLVFLNELT